MAVSQSGIFISYRRESAAALAGRLYDSLSARLGRDRVFIDIDHIELGEDFAEVLENKLEHAVAMIVLIGRDWVTCKDAHGKARLEDPDDFVRLEIATALNRNVRVIPVLFDGARVPSSQDLPPDLASLSRRQAIEIDHGRFHQDAAKLIDVCQKMLAQRVGEEAEQAALAKAERVAREKATAEERERESSRAETEQIIRGEAETAKADTARKFDGERKPKEAVRLAELQRQEEAERKAREQARSEQVVREPAAAGAETSASSKNTTGVRFFGFVLGRRVLGVAGTATVLLAGYFAVSRFSGSHAARERGSDAAGKIVDLKTPAVPADAARQRGAGETSVNAKDGLKYVWIPPGSFTIGCSPGDNECRRDEKPAHDVTITKGFQIGQTEVTQAAYQRVIGSNPSHFKGDNRPVESVEWKAAGAYCRAIGGRLPTEAEWEYAARAGTGVSRYGDIDEIAWYDGNSGSQTHDVGKKTPNAWGLYDMLGNVWEWTADWYGKFSGGKETDPKGADHTLWSPPSGDARVFRGGCWGNYPRTIRASDRYYDYFPGACDGIGFRCILP